jgi:hypothetical protein
MASCRHPICELIGDDTCSIASGRSRGCTPVLAAKTIAPPVFDEVRALLAAIATGDRDAAIRLAAIVRREAREDHTHATTSPRSRSNSPSCSFGVDSN